MGLQSSEWILECYNLTSNLTQCEQVAMNLWELQPLPVGVQILFYMFGVLMLIGFVRIVLMKY